MRKFILALLLTSALTAGAQGFVTHRAQIARQLTEQGVRKAETRGMTVPAESKRGYFFVNCEQGANAQQVADQLKSAGAQIRMVRGDMILLDAPYSKLDALANTKGVWKIDVSPRVSKKTDVNRKVTQAGEVIDGTGEKLPQAYTGKGVIVGIIDNGFDFTHPIFKDKDGKLRIKGVYEPGNFKFGGDSVRIDGEALTGSYYSKAEDILDTLKVKDTDGSHGTHCISIAAGSTSDVKGVSGNPLGGIAPEADILICPASGDSDYYKFCSDNQTDATAYMIVESLEYLRNEAKKLQQPIVVTMSLNAHDGWHDGSSNMARVIGSYAKEGKLPIMLCTSNEGGDQMYLNMKSAAKDTVSVLASPGQGNGYVWGGMKTKKNVTMQIAIVSLKDGHKYYQMPIEFNSDPNTGDYGDGTYFYAGEDADNSHLEGEEKEAVEGLLKYIKDGDIQIWCYQNQAMNQDGKPYIYTELFLSMSDLAFISQIYNRGDKPEEDVLGFKINLIPEEETELHCWGDQGVQLVGQDNDLNYKMGDSSVSVGDWNTSGNPVSIGAWAANNKIKEKGMGKAVKQNFEVDDVTYFSSYGTDLAGHKHPTVCTPGLLVVAAANSFDPDKNEYNIYEDKGYNNQFTGQKDERDYPYVYMSGTSMATPCSAGIVALWIQAAMDKGRQLTCEDIKDIIAHSSDTDEYTKAKPERFGAGKMNAYKGLLYVLGIDTSIPTLSKQQPKDVTFRVVGDIVYTDGADDGTETTIYNLQGVSVRQTKVQSGTISLAGLQEGVYAVQLGNLGSTLIRKSH